MTFSQGIGYSWHQAKQLELWQKTQSYFALENQNTSYGEIRMQGNERIIPESI